MCQQGGEIAHNFERERSHFKGLRASCVLFGCVEPLPMSLGTKFLLISNDPVLAFGHLGELFVFSSSSFSFAQVVRVLVLIMHSSRGRL